MSEAEVVKVSSKGQVTIPGRFRKELGLDRDSHLYVARVGGLLIMRRVDGLSLEEVSSVLSKMAEDRGITKELLLEEAERAREELMEEREHMHGIKNYSFFKICRVGGGWLGGGC